MMKLFIVLFTTLLLAGCSAESNQQLDSAKGNVIFLHPDGTGVGHWNLLRLVTVGPDGMTNWDRMTSVGLYRPHQRNSLVTTSQAGATVHAFGKKVHNDSYGMDFKKPLIALSGKPMSIMQEAMADGVRVGVINSGHVAEPGSGVFLASHETRAHRTKIADKILASGADVMFSGGEIYTLPKGVIGRHGQEGEREDGRNILKEAEAKGYKVIYTREELQSLPADTQKVIGIFAAKDTYNDKPEELLIEAGLPVYNPEQPSYDEMVAVALKILSHDTSKRFFLVAEEEGTDNFSNSANTTGTIEALKRTDAAIGHVMRFIDERTAKDTMLVVAADSDAGHPAVWGYHLDLTRQALPSVSETGAQVDGISGTGTLPFQSAPDANGVTYKFGVAWPMTEDGYGSAVTKTYGYKSDRLGVVVDNTDIYKITYDVLFDKKLD